VRQKFTSAERDDEIGLDFMQARYYVSGMGRLTSVDPVALTVEWLYDPQQINLHAYCRNNPLAFIDGRATAVLEKRVAEAEGDYLFAGGEAARLASPL
jgi:RHS repeat-associated protein